MIPLSIYTDLDGTLLDHHDYSHAAADALLRDLAQQQIPVIFCTSKTRAELLALRRELNNEHPFIAENGAAVFVPIGNLPCQPDETTIRDDFWVKEFVPPRAHWLSILEQLDETFGGCFRRFHDMDTHQLADLTGLSLAQAELAARREYGEPVQWLAGDSEQEAFIRELGHLGARVLRGGRFLHVSGDCDKGLALRWLNRQLATGDCEPVSVALGDSHNDVAMLEAADYAVLVRSPVHPMPELRRRSGTIKTSATGPRGWVEGVNQIIRTINDSRG